MKFTLATIAAAAAFLPVIEAHLYMNMPGLYRTGDNMPPLAESGANFPCSVDSFTANEDGPTLNPGQGAEIKLFGTAVHSGGSCQISITYDQPPNKNSQWKVMKSFEGGCPVRIDGNLPAGGDPTTNALPPLPYTVPSNLPAGPATIAWTWFNRSGNREMYMRCHKATIGGGNSDKGAFNSLPDMLVANIATRDCRVREGVNVKFPNPGSELVGSGDGAPEGSQCGGGGSPPPSNQSAPPPPGNQSPPPNNTTPPKTVLVGGACSSGQTKCDGKTWSMCSNGQFINMGSLAAGTDCSAISKRSIRFSGAHMAKRAL